MLLLPFENIKPNIHPSVFLAKGSVVTGDVEIGEDSSI
ncbi:gamma carbonic anhydrase family protein, partial [Mesorhizobium sp. M00.F.Ca.ET.186.01.1.1]